MEYSGGEGECFHGGEHAECCLLVGFKVCQGVIWGAVGEDGLDALADR